MTPASPTTKGPRASPTTTHNQQILSGAPLPFLGQAVFGPARHDYWMTALATVAKPEQQPPTAGRLAEIRAEIAELETALAD